MASAGRSNGRHPWTTISGAQRGPGQGLGAGGEQDKVSRGGIALVVQQVGTAELRLGGGPEGQGLPLKRTMSPAW